MREDEGEERGGEMEEEIKEKGEIVRHSLKGKEKEEERK